MADKKQDYPGDEATVSWQGDLCIHVGECGRANGDLFVAGRKPWCDPNQSSNDQTQEVVERCPTGALSMQMGDGINPEKPSTVNTISVSPDGPLYLRGDLQIDKAPADQPGLKYRAALCRCGQSSNKPFCDNSHQSTNFKDYGAIGVADDSVQTPGGALTVKTLKDGPLMVQGNVDVYSGSGRRAMRVQKTVLCRCGASQNKPFCDGSHVRAGFTDE